MEIKPEQKVVRRKVASVCWFAAAGILIMSGPDVGILFEWRELVFLAWVVARIAFLVYTGVLLWDADQEIDSLKHTQNRLEEIIAQLQGSPPGS
jgi:hypothetical protein